jgi:uncharacterized membrane protein (UPF0127 family)
MLCMSNRPAAPVLCSLREIEVGQALRVINETRGVELVSALALALGPISRLRGLLGRAPLAAEEGLLLRPCQAVHTFFMTYPIDVLFLDETGRVVGLRPELRPWRMTPFFGDALATLELASGRATATGTARGDRLRFERVGGA